MEEERGEGNTACPFPPSVMCNQTRTDAAEKPHTYTQTHTGTYTLTQMHTLTHGHWRTHCHSRTHTHAHAQPPTEHAHTHFSSHMARGNHSTRPRGALRYIVLVDTFARVEERASFCTFPGYLNVSADANGFQMRDRGTAGRRYS